MANRFGYTSFNEFDHHNVSENPAQTLLYLFVLDSMNFCFWPLEGFEYEHLAASIKNYILKSQTDRECLGKLMGITEQDVVEIVFGGVSVPLADERARIVREMASVIWS